MLVNEPSLSRRGRLESKLSPAVGAMTEMSAVGVQSSINRGNIEYNFC